MLFSKNKLLKFQTFSVIFTWILGTILHFTYEWSNENIMFAAFSAINESYNYDYWIFLFEAYRGIQEVFMC